MPCVLVETDLSLFEHAKQIYPRLAARGAKKGHFILNIVLFVDNIAIISILKNDSVTKGAQ